RESRGRRRRRCADRRLPHAHHRLRAAAQLGPATSVLVRAHPRDPPRQAERTLRPAGSGSSMKRNLPALVAVVVVAGILVLLPFVLSDYNTFLAGEVGIFFIAVLGLNILTGY